MLCLGFLVLLGAAFGPGSVCAEGRAVCGTLLLERQQVSAPMRLKPTVLSTRTGAEPSIGESKDFWVYSFLTGSYYLTTAICRHIGEHAYVFVETEQWLSSVYSEDVDVLARTFDRSTARYSDRGIFDLEVEAFGAPPDVDRDPRVYLLVLDVEDGALGSADYVAGFFDPRDLGLWGNQHEILYMDCRPLDLRSDLAMATLAHEFQHLIHYGYDHSEEPWVNEGCSGYAESVCGYAEGYGNAFLAETDNSLTYFGGSGVLGTVADYDKTFLFITYLAEQFGGAETIRTLVSRPERGIVGMDRALEALGCTERFEDVFLDWTVANYLDDEGRYGYRSVVLRPAAVSPEPVLPIERWDLRVQPWAADYVEFTSGQDMRIRFEGDDSFRIRLISRRAGETSVMALLPDDLREGEISVERGDTVALVVARIGPAVGRYAYVARERPPMVIAVSGETMDTRWGLAPNRPNPFNASTEILLQVGASARVTADVFDLSGRRVRTLTDALLTPGEHTIRWDGTAQDGSRSASGVYLVRMRAGTHVFARRMMLIR